MLLWGLLGFAAFYGIRSLTATGSKKEELQGSAKSYLIGAAVVFVLAIVIVAAVS